MSAACQHRAHFTVHRRPRRTPFFVPKRNLMQGYGVIRHELQWWTVGVVGDGPCALCSTHPRHRAGLGLWRRRGMAGGPTGRVPGSGCQGSPRMAESGRAAPGRAELAGGAVVGMRGLVSGGLRRGGAAATCRGAAWRWPGGGLERRRLGGGLGRGGAAADCRGATREGPRVGRLGGGLGRCGTAPATGEERIW